MKVIYQFFIILLFTFVGDLISLVLPFNMPGAIIGLLLLLLFLILKIIKVEEVYNVSLWLQKNMSFLFIPLSVGIMKYFDILKIRWLEFLIITVVSTLATLIITALYAERCDKNG